jgi:hypothetical protein
MSYYLWLDDTRPKPQTTYEWKVAKNIDEFKKLIMDEGMPKYISFDHDLEEMHYFRKYDDMRTGLDCVDWLIKYTKEHEYPFPKWSIHTMNYIRAVDMRGLLLVHAPDEMVPDWKDLEP